MVISTDHKICSICDFSFNDCLPETDIDGMLFCKYCCIGTTPFGWHQVKECNPLSCIRKDCNHA